MWAQTCLGTNCVGTNGVGTSVSMHKRVWAQTCLRTNVCRHKRVRTQLCGHNRVGSSIYGHKRVVFQWKEYKNKVLRDMAIKTITEEMAPYHVYNQTDAKSLHLMPPSLCSVDGSYVGERVSWTYLTLTSMDVIDSLSAALTLYCQFFPHRFSGYSLI